MRSAILVTGAAGEIGSNLINELAGDAALSAEPFTIVALDLHEVPECDRRSGVDYLAGDILDERLTKSLAKEYDFHSIFHLASILSTAGEREPERTHRVNVEGSLNLLRLARMQSEHRRRATRFVFPSTIAVYGLSASAEGPKGEELKRRVGPVREDQFQHPITMYGVNKLEVEHLGRYFARHYRLLDEEPGVAHIDFRCVRLPGVLSANSLPSGGTSDYAPEMIHAVVQGKPYRCFCRPETKIPFMTMPDAVAALLGVWRGTPERLTRTAYNVSGFSVSAEELCAELVQRFPESHITFAADPRRIAILDSWPEAVDDTAARNDWGWSPSHGLREALDHYLLPGVLRRYAGGLNTGEAHASEERSVGGNGAGHTKATGRNEPAAALVNRSS